MKTVISISLMVFIMSCSASKSVAPHQKSATAEATKDNDNATGGPSDDASGEIPSDGDDPAAAVVCAEKVKPTPNVSLLPPSTSMIRTVSAGRVRQRHESNGTFAGFGDHYFEKRSFEFIVEDYTPTGEKKVKITLKPLGIAGTGAVLADGTMDVGLPNIRMIQNGGTNPDLFNINQTLKNEGNNVYTFTLTDDGNAPERSLAPGRIFSFEFGFFFNKKEVEGRNSYYSDTFRIVMGKPGLIVGIPLTPEVGGDPQAHPDRKYYSAGDYTVPGIMDAADKHLAYSQSSLNILQPDMQGFLEGRSLFHSNFVTGKHSETAITFSDERIAKQKGLAGPEMDANACSVCHSENGRFQAGAMDNPAHVLKISGMDGKAHPQFGLQLQRSEQAASKIKLENLSKIVSYEDGTKVTLTYPKYSLEGAVISARIPQVVYGLGLFEAIAPETLLARVGCDEKSPGITGRAGYAINPETGKKELARFGWKASKVSLKHQVSEALLFDIGVTSALFPTAECEKTGVCGSSASSELPKEDVDRLVKYMQNIAVPVQRNTADPAFARGQAVFAKLGCGGCHIPQQYTGNTHPNEKLRNQTFAPYTDLLLHDMGPGLADNKVDGSASGSEWRTAPLWGLGLMKTVNGQIMLLNDGRAKSYEEAILWHDGEAAFAQTAFRKLIKADRDDLIFFLGSI